MADIRLPIVGAPLPASFAGTPQEFFTAVVKRVRAVFPTGQTGFVIQSETPTTNLGPWLKGSEWWVWDSSTKTYIPLNVDDSLVAYSISSTDPENGDEIPAWLQFSGTRALWWNYWTGDEWVVTGVTRGTTAERPDDAAEFERYFDTDLGVELFFYRRLWRTVDGSPGDIKHVTAATLAEALAKNPGWREIGQYFSDDGVRGRALVAASLEAGQSGSSDGESEGDELTIREWGEQYGTETHTVTINEFPAHTHESWEDALRFEPDEDGNFAMSLFNAPGPWWYTTGAFTSESTGDGDPHNNIPRTIALWTLVKLF